jgi:hypothetical protein
MLLSCREARAASTSVFNNTGLSTNGSPSEFPMKNGITDAKAAGFSQVQIKDGLKITALRQLLDIALSSTARFAIRYLSRNSTGDLKVQPASAAEMNTNGFGLSGDDEALAERQSIAVNPCKCI